MVPTPTEPPTADWVDPAEMVRDPYATYERLRELGPVVWVPAMGKYLAVSFAACRDVEADQETFSASVTGGTMARALGATPMLRKDDPEHAAERQPVNATMRPRSIRQTWVPVFERNARTHLDVLREVGPEAADLDRDYAAPVAAQNLIDLLGLKGAAVADMHRWSHAFIAGTGNLHDDADVWRRCDAARAEVDALLEDLVPHYRAHPDESMTSAFANSGMPDGAVAANVKLTIAGGMNEPQHMVTALVWALSGHPDQRRRVLADPSAWPAVFDEAVRWLSPIGMYPRQTTRETVLAGMRLPAQAPIGVVVAAANRDPAEFDRPSVFDSARPRQSHLGFGSGVHLCAGHWAARISIGEIAVPLAYEVLTGLRTDPRRSEQWAGWVFRGLTSLPVTWGPAQDPA
ncbi:cytochrome P450 [Klenkia sp. LSe6-5]|uniref:Cytochrome P450 n=1 Tax=Klenkia sesuvii TaxID=3103137 RepID=A0ABU8DQS5_9ACTN